MKIGKIIVTVCVAAQLLCSTAIMSNCVYADGNAPLSNSSVVYGDVTGDAMVDSADYSLMKKYLLGKITDMEAPNWKITGDLNLDGIIDMADYSILRKYLINVITSLPLGAEHKLTSPSCISTSAVGTNISVTWDAVKDAASYDLAIDEQAPISVTGTVYKHEGVKANTEHTYRIRAVNTKATSEWVAVLKISAPEVPNWEGRHTSATISGSREESCILFCWNKVENATGYIVSINGKEVKTTGDAYDYEGCDFSIPNRFKVKAVNENGESDWSKEYVVDAWDGLNMEVPNWIGRQSDIHKGRTRGENYILFRWNKVEFATGYILSINGKEVKTTEDAYDYEGCDFSIPNRFKLKAVNDYGESDWSEEYVVDAR